MPHARFTTLISTQELARHLGDPDWAVVDCRFDLATPSWGRQAWEQEHIAGAGFADLDRDLSGDPTGHNGRHPLPDLERLADALGRWGAADGVQLVVYDQDVGMYASRLWWLARLLGHDQVAVLDGGFAKWTRDGHPTRSGTESPTPRAFTSSLRPERMVDAGAVRQALEDGRSLLVDARAPERYEGRTEPLDPVAGHIPGAVNRFFRQNLAPDGTFHAPETLREQFRQLLGTTASDNVICYCGSGVTACHDLLAMERAGLGGARLYPGSWSEWCSDPTRPIASGPGPAHG